MVKRYSKRGGWPFGSNSNNNTGSYYNRARQGMNNMSRRAYNAMPSMPSWRNSENSGNSGGISSWFGSSGQGNGTGSWFGSSGQGNGTGSWLGRSTPNQGMMGQGQGMDPSMMGQGQQGMGSSMFGGRTRRVRGGMNKSSSYANHYASVKGGRRRMKGTRRRK